jgi:hypothetical protein
VGRYSDRARRKIAENSAGWRDCIFECLQEAGDRLPRATDRRSLATFVLTVMEGAVMQARTHKDIAYFDSSIEHLRRYVDQLLEEGNREREQGAWGV